MAGMVGADLETTANLHRSILRNQGRAEEVKVQAGKVPVELREAIADLKAAMDNTTWSGTTAEEFRKWCDDNAKQCEDFCQQCDDMIPVLEQLGAILGDSAGKLKANQEALAAATGDNFVV